MKRKVVVWTVTPLIVVAGLIGASTVLSAPAVEPRLCASCHVMEPQYRSFAQSVHAGQVSCSDCHLPHDGFAESLVAKFTSGTRHLWAAVSGNVPAEVRLRPEGERWVARNCVSCHSLSDHVRESGTESCFHCHAGEPHGEEVLR